MSSEIDLEIPGYDIIEPIGRGGMASVYRARQHSFDRNVAIKVLKPDLSEDDAFCQRFVMESLIVAKLNHSNIVQVYDVGEIKNHYYIAMEFLSGGDLHKRLKGGLPASEAVSVIKQIASALDFAHRKNIIHRDLKPDNVMFREDEAAVLTDFGIAKETDADINLTQTGLIVGTPKYMSPEQIRGNEPTPQGDIYSLGIMFYQLLCNRVPFEGPDLIATAYKHFNDPVPLLPPHLSQYQELLENMLAKSAEDRIARGKDVAKELERIERDHPIQERTDDTVVLQKSAADNENDKTLVKQASIETKLFSKSETGVGPSDPTLVKSGSNKNQDNVSTPTPIGTNPNQKIDRSSNNNEATGQNTASAAAPKNENKTKPFIFAGIAAAVVLSVASFSLLSPPKTSKVAPTPAKAIRVSEAPSEQVTNLLLEALTALGENRLRKGEGNALSKYEQILIIAPGNSQALAGKKTIAKKYLSLAKSAINNKNFGNAQDHIDNATDINPGIDISSVQNRLDVAKRNQKSPITTLKKVQIAGLLENANIFEKDGNLFSPAGANANENYLKVLEIDPYNSEAKRKLSVLQAKR